jgi:hypothetical protein
MECPWQTQNWTLNNFLTKNMLVLLNNQVTPVDYWVNQVRRVESQWVPNAVSPFNRTILVFPHTLLNQTLDPVGYEGIYEMDMMYNIITISIVGVRDMKMLPGHISRLMEYIITLCKCVGDVSLLNEINFKVFLYVDSVVLNNDSLNSQFIRKADTCKTMLGRILRKVYTEYKRTLRYDNSGGLLPPQQQKSLFGQINQPFPAFVFK